MHRRYQLGMMVLALLVLGSNGVYAQLNARIEVEFRKYKPPNR